jgi:hypothetical protein
MYRAESKRNVKKGLVGIMTELRSVQTREEGIQLSDRERK